MHLVNETPTFILRKRPFQHLGFLAIVAILIVVIANRAVAEDIPSNSHSLNVIAKVQLDLSRELSAIGSKFGAPVFIRIFKEEEALEAWLQVSEKFELFRTYYICDYCQKLGPKEREGDRRSPEGFYRVKPAQMNPYSQFHLAFDLGYPNNLDLSHGRTGNAIMIHGGCFSKGCFAMTDGQIEEIYALADAALRNGQPFFQVHIFPFRMTEENMRRFKELKWYTFWSNLQEGYDYFERKKRPPQVTAKCKRYAFE